MISNKIEVKVIKSSIISLPFLIDPCLSGRNVINPHSPPTPFTLKWKTVYIIIHATLHVDQSDCLFKCWKLGFLLIFGCKTSKLHVPNLFHFAFQFFMENWYRPSSSLNSTSPTSSISPPPPLSIKPFSLKCAWNQYGGGQRQNSTKISKFVTFPF